MEQDGNDLIEPCATAKPARLRILLADDSRLMQTLLGRLLRELGHEVTVVGTGRAAVDSTEQHQFDLVFMDLEMPMMGGVEATLAIRERDVAKGWRVPIIAMTAHEGDVFKRHCLDIGMDGYVTKPVEMSGLWALLSSIPAHSPV